MVMRRWKAKIRLNNGSIQDIYVDADNIGNARAMIEGQYGVGCIISGPNPA